MSARALLVVCLGLGCASKPSVPPASPGTTYTVIDVRVVDLDVEVNAEIAAVEFPEDD